MHQQEIHSVKLSDANHNTTNLNVCFEACENLNEQKGKLFNLQKYEGLLPSKRGIGISDEVCTWLKQVAKQCFAKPYPITLV